MSELLGAVPFTVEGQKVRDIFASIVEESDLEMKIVDEPMMTT